MPFITMGGTTPRYLLYFPRKRLKRADISVAQVPPRMSIGPKAPGLRRFDRKQPIVTPGIPTVPKAGSKEA